MPFVPRDTTLVTIFAGPNDVNTLTDALGSGAGGSDPVGYIDQKVAAFAADYATLLAGIRSRAPGARIVHPQRAESRRHAVSGRRHRCRSSRRRSGRRSG